MKHKENCHKITNPDCKCICICSYSPNTDENAGLKRIRNTLKDLLADVEDIIKVKEDKLIQ